MLISETGSTDDDSIIDVAQTLDQHIMQNWANDARDQRRPQPIIPSGGNVKAQLGQEFTIKLTNVADSLGVKFAEPQESEIVIQTETASKDGVFKFVALGKGRTSVRFCVAHSNTLAVAEVEVGVEVS